MSDVTDKLEIFLEYVQLLKGDVTMECEDALTSDEKADGFILACQAIANRDVEVDA